MKVRYMYEYMALCADPTLFANIDEPRGIYPVPSGVPTGITVMPDFVVDVHASVLTPSAGRVGPAKAFRPIDVGSRAGRLVWVLQEFGGDKNGLYQVNYVAKAGHLGRQVLEARLQREAARRDGDPLGLRYVFPAGDADWVTIYHDASGSGLPKPLAESQPEELELTRSDVSRSPFRPQDVFYGTRYVVVSSKHADRAIEALALAEEGLRQLAPLSEELRAFTGEQQGAGGAKPPIGLLLDLSALKRDETSDRRKRLLSRFGATCRNLSGLYSVDATVLCDGEEQEARDLAARFTNVLWRSARGRRVRLWHSGTLHAKQTVPVGVNLKHLVTREALTAGYVLAATCDLAWQLLCLWADYDPQLRPLDGSPRTGHPVRREPASTPDPLPGGDILPPVGGEARPLDPAERLHFGVLLAQAMPREPVGYYGVVCHHGSGSRLSGMPGLEIEVAKVLTGVPVDTERGKTLLAQRQAWGDLGHPNHTRPRFQSPRSEQGPFLPPRVANPLVGSCHVRDLTRALPMPRDEVLRVVMFDLDATLIDSPRLRRACWSAGLKGFFRLTPPNPGVTDADIEMIVTIYETFIYANNTLFARLLAASHDVEPEWQPWDFRQVWDHPYAWAALLWLIDDQPRSQQVRWNRHTWETIMGTPADHVRFTENGQSGELVPQGNCLCVACRRLRSLADAPDLAAAFQPLRDRRLHFATAIDAARYAFWAVDVGDEGGIDRLTRRIEYAAHPQARACVQAIRSQSNCEVYVVTEGHPDTQFRKLRCAGLHDLFPRERVLATGAAGNPANARGDLDALRRRYEAEVQLLEAMESCGGATGAGCAIRRLLRERRRHLQAVELLLSLISVLQLKGAQSFYSAVIDAIRLNPRSPAELLRSFTEQRQAVDRRALQRALRARRKFVMIGDRYDYDCRPLLDLLASSGPNNQPRVAVLRVWSGRRAVDGSPPTEGPSATYVCDSLLQVAHVLGGQTVWGAIEPLEGPLPPVLLSETAGRIRYGAPAYAKLLAPKLPLLAFAATDDELGRLRAVRDILAMIVQDLSLCSVPALESFWRSLAGRVSRMWGNRDAVTYQGTLQLLRDINWWCWQWRRPPCGAAAQLEETLEWVLASHLLRSLNRPDLLVGGRPLRPASAPAPEHVDPSAIVNAIPFSETGRDIVETLGGTEEPAVAADIELWLSRYKRLGRRRGGDSLTAGAALV